MSRRRPEALDRSAARTLELLARRLCGQVGAVLVYHRLGERPGDPARELVPALGLDEFRRQAEVVAARYRPVPLTSLFAEVSARRRADRLPVALTFDDDLLSHLTFAVPVLAAAGLPAAFFLGGATLDRPRRFWWEHLQALVDERGAEPVSAELGLAAGGSIHALARAIESLEPSHRREVEHALAEAAGDAGTQPRLDRVGVQRLARGGFEIGFHTLRHEVLTLLPDEALRRSLADGREALADAAGVSVDLVAYPHGKADERVAAAARASGYRYGFTGMRGRVTPATDPFLIPRNELRAGPRPFRSALARLAAGIDEPRA